MRANSSSTGLVLLVSDKEAATDGVDVLLGMMGGVRTVSVSDLAGLPACVPDFIVYDIDIDSVSGLRNIRTRLSWPELRSVPRYLVSDRDDVRNVALNALLDVDDIIERPVTAERLRRIRQRSAAAAFESTIAGTPYRVRAGLSGLNRLFGKMLAPQAGALNWTEVTVMEKGAVDAVRAVTMDGWLEIVEQHHSPTFRHCLSVTGIAVSFARQLGFAEAEQRKIARAAIIHDIGKASIPLAILDKPGKLSREEAAIMQTHPQLGYDRIVRQAEVTTDVMDMVLHHHELLDGSGYPHGLSGAEISPLVRLITISDIFSALIERRAYKEAFSREKAYSLLVSMAGMLDPGMTRAFASIALGQRSA